jgi:hypothetical protein
LRIAVSKAHWAFSLGLRIEEEVRIQKSEVRIQNEFVLVLVLVIVLFCLLNSEF